MANLKIKLLPRSSLKGKVGVRFPASLTGEGGIVVTTAGRDVTIGLNADTVAAAVATPLITAYEATQAEAIAGTATGKIMSPLRTKNAIQGGAFFTQDGTGASDRTLIAKLKERVSIADFGASPTATAAANATAIQAAIDAAQLAGKAVFIPPGEYDCNAQITSGDGDISIYGVGFASRIVFTNSASAGFNLHPRVYSAGVYDNVFMGNLVILADAVCTDAAIKISLATRVPNSEQKITLENINIAPATFGTKSFAVGVYLERTVFAHLVNVDYLGTSAGTGKTGFYFQSVVGVQMVTCNSNFTENAIWCDVLSGDLATEGIEITGGDYFNTKRGIYIGGLAAAGNLLDLRMVGVHIATSLGAATRIFDWDGVYQSDVTGCLLYGFHYPCMDLKEVVGTAFTGNKIYGVAGYGGSDILVKLSATSYNNLFTGNYLALAGVGIRFEASTDVSNILTGTIFNDITTRITAGAGAETTGGFNAEIGSADFTNSAQDSLGTIGGTQAVQGRFRLSGISGDTSALMSWTPFGGAASFQYHDTSRNWNTQDATNGIIWTMSNLGVQNIGRTGAITGSMTWSGGTSGVGTLTAAAAQGSPTWTWGTTTGTIAVSGNHLGFFAATTSAQLAGVISDETGSGALVFGTSPTIASPSITGDVTQTSTSAGVVGPAYVFFHDSASPAASDVLGYFQWRGRDSGGTATNYAALVADLVSPTDGAETGRIRLDAINSGVSGVRWYWSAAMYGATTTGGDTGPETVNCIGYYVSGTKVVGARDTGFAAMTGTPNEGTVYDTATVTLPQLAGRVAAIQAALTTHGLIGA